SQISGRGVGMDVVNSEIKAMGGNLLIDSTPGVGTSFTIRLPFTMAANPVLFVDVQDQPYAIPLGSIQGLSRIDAETLQQHLGRDEKLLRFNDEDYPVHYLGSALGHERRFAIKPDAMYALVYTRAGGYCVAWVVDAVQGRRDIILQSLGALFKTCHFYSAATITSEGDVVMVPDMLELTERMLTTPDTERLRAETLPEETVEAVVHEIPHIMIVDDSITVRKVTEKLLRHENFVVETAKDGLEALEKLDSFEPDLMLLDIEMPRMDGFEVLSAVRANERWSRVPIIMISSRTAEKHRDHAEQLGATDFLGKPYQSQALLEHIGKYLDYEASGGEATEIADMGAL
ncbi:MAG: response regulator, partial [Thiolinea sp.]